MRKIYFVLSTLFFLNVSYSQQMATLRLTAVEEPESSYSEMRPIIDLGNHKVVAIMGGLNDWDGMNNYFNIYGSKVIVQSRDVSSKGVITLTLRREDGDNFFGQYPTLKADIIPHEALIIHKKPLNNKILVP